MRFSIVLYIQDSSYCTLYYARVTWFRLNYSSQCRWKHAMPSEWSVFDGQKFCSWPHVSWYKIQHNPAICKEFRLVFMKKLFLLVLLFTYICPKCNGRISAVRIIIIKCLYIYIIMCVHNSRDVYLRSEIFNDPST